MVAQATDEGKKEWRARVEIIKGIECTELDLGAEGAG